MVSLTEIFYWATRSSQELAEDDKIDFLVEFLSSCSDKKKFIKQKGFSADVLQKSLYNLSNFVY